METKPTNPNSNSNNRPGGGGFGGRGRGRGGAGGRPPFNKEKRDKEFEEKVLEVARVTRVVKGGKRFKFRAAVVIGDKKGRVGFGLGKGSDVAQSVAKAVHQAKKHLINVPIVNGTIPLAIKVKYSSAIVFLKPAPAGRGINAGGAVRVVSELSGLKDIIGKILSRSGSKINNTRATLKALELIAIKAKR
ncbi:MAG: 30S ribosomal protein S5 [bacterium]|nr:30S ribosomal protein S5 [bacterium]